MNYYNEIKNELINNEINRKVKNYSINKSDLTTYYNVGKLLSEAGKHYGDGIIKEYSNKLTNELNLNYTKSSLYNMINYYKLISDSKFQTVSGKLSWSHYTELLSIKDKNKIIYYLHISEKQNLSVRELRNRIKSNEYERLPKETRNKLIKKAEIKAFVKEPITIKNKNNYEIISEKVLQRLILEDIEDFMKELGNSFCFIGSEYKIKIGTSYNYIDLLLYNYEYNCFVVIELKVTELKKEHIGQIEVYMNYIDNNLKSINQNKTIGIIIVRKNNNYIMEYCSDKRILSKEYHLI